MSSHPTLNTFDPAPILREYPGRSDREIAEILGVTTLTVRNWRTGRRQLKAAAADRLAIRLGTHPALYWPHWTHEEAA